MPIVLLTPSASRLSPNVIDIAKVLEHAFRRAKVHPSKQTPENVTIAKESLYLLLTNLANRGLNLWCVESNFVGLANGQPVYDMAEGTIDVLNVTYCQPTRLAGTDSTTATTTTTDLAAPNTVRRIGVKFSSVSPSDTVALSASSDAVTWTTLIAEARTDWASGTWYWFELDALTTSQYFRVATNSPSTASEFYLASQVTDLPVVQWSRDTWSVINNKAQLGRPSTNYYLERLLNPRLTLWPVPNNDYDHLMVFSQRKVENVGMLSEYLDLPERWHEHVIWQLALRLVMELPDGDMNMLQAIQGMVTQTMLDVEHNESDGAPIMLQPNVGVYTR